MCREGQLSQVSLLYFRDGKIYVILCFHWKIMGAEVHILFPHLWKKASWPEIVVLHKKLSLSSKFWDSIILWIIWWTMLPQHSILQDLFTWKNSRCSNNCGTHCRWSVLLFLYLWYRKTVIKQQFSCDIDRNSPRKYFN